MLKRLQTELDLERLLGQANSNDTPTGFLARTGAISLMTFALLLAAYRGRASIRRQLAGAAMGGVAVDSALILPLSLGDLRSEQVREARQTRPEPSETCSWRSQ